MRFYNVHFEKYETVAMFAPNLEEVGHLVDIYLALNFAKDPQFQISQPNMSNLSTLESGYLQAAIALNAIGYGLYDRQAGWRVVPLWQQPLKLKLR